MLPIGWAVFDARGGAALFLERPRADEFAARVHGTVEQIYSATQVATLLDEISALAGKEATPPPGDGQGEGVACSRH